MTTGTILWILAIGAFFYFMMKGGGCCGGHGHGGHGGHSGRGDEEHRGKGHQVIGHEVKNEEPSERYLPEEAKDPVCGMAVDDLSGTEVSEYMGRTFHFCSAQCKKLFDLHPAHYLRSVNAQS